MHDINYKLTFFILKKQEILSVSYVSILYYILLYVIFTHEPE